MSSNPSPDAWTLSHDAVPFVRDLVLEVARRLPTGFGTCLRVDPTAMSSVEGCLGACGSLLTHLDDVVSALGQTAGEVDAAFVSLLTEVQEIEARLHRAVLQARSRVDDEVAFTHTVRGVLRELVSGDDRPDAARETVRRLLDQIEARQGIEREEVLALSSGFDLVEEDLRSLREKVSGLEKRTRRFLGRSQRDPLTGLWNRQACQERLAEEILRARRYRAPLSIVVWDVDDLRRFNEEHGYEAGDSLLRTLAARVLGLLRRSDFVARWGSDQFVTVLPNTPPAQAAIVAAKIGGAARYEDEGNHLVTVAVSTGVAGLEPEDDASTLFARAERALAAATSSPVAG